jgi:hypothetical protein
MADTEPQEQQRRATGRVGHPSGSEDFGINVACWGATWHLYVNGRLDGASTAAMIDIAEVLAARGAPAVDLDLAGVTSIDDEGWRAARYAQDLLAAAGTTCRMIPPTPGTGPVIIPAALRAEALLAAAS